MMVFVIFKSNLGQIIARALPSCWLVANSQTKLLCLHTAALWNKNDWFGH
jgi:hypothetical protein